MDDDVFRWGYLEVYTSESVEDIWQAYGAGIVESYTQKLSKMNMIATHIHNTIGTLRSVSIRNNLETVNNT